MRKAIHFVDHIITMAQQRNPGTRLSIHSTTWPEFKNESWRNSVNNILINLEYSPFRTVQWIMEPNGVLLTMVTRPGAELTGRLKRDPNLQQIPIRTEMGQRIIAAVKGWFS